MRKKSIAGLSAVMLFSCGTVVEEKNSYLSSPVDVSSLSSVETKESSQENEHSSVISSSLETSSLPSSVEEESLFKYEYHAPASLPKISITTTDNSNDFATVPTRLNKWDYVDAKVSVSNCDETYQLDEVDAGVKVRGNYTADYSKKPFRIKFNKKQKMLGLNDDLKVKSWVLLAEVKDASMLHNAYSFCLGNQLLGQQGLYCSDFVPVSLEINNTYWGMYLLCEQQQVNSGRVDIMDVEDLDDEQGNHYLGNDIGYLFEYDGYYEQEGEDGDPTFTINHPQDNIPTFKGGSAWCGQHGYTIKSTIY
nr:CotH kinase family protein [Bacilli bacterium]